MADADEVTVTGWALAAKAGDTSAATRFIRQNKAMMISGSVSSSVAIALQNTCHREKTLYFPLISGSSDTTGKDCKRYGFRLCRHAYTAAKAISPTVRRPSGAPSAPDAPFAPDGPSTPGTNWPSRRVKRRDRRIGTSGGNAPAKRVRLSHW